MSLNIQIKEVNSHLLVKAAGHYTLPDLHGLFQRAKAESEHRSNIGVILDVSEVAGSIPLLDMLVLGEYCSRSWKQAFKTAVVSSAGGLNQFFEDVASHRGAQIAVVPNQNAAWEWLR